MGLLRLWEWWGESGRDGSCAEKSCGQSGRRQEEWCSWRTATETRADWPRRWGLTQRGARQQAWKEERFGLFLGAAVDIAAAAGVADEDDDEDAAAAAAAGILVEMEEESKRERGV